MFHLFINCLIISVFSQNTTCDLKVVDFVCGTGSGCVNGTCGKCIDDSHCSEQSFCNNGVCEHRGLFPLSGWTAISIIGSFGISILGGATGLGGGSFVVPVLCLCSGFTSTQAVAIAQATIFGNGVVAFINGIFGRHPTRNRPRISFDILFVMFPSLLAGSFLGVFVAPLVPQFVITILLCFFLISTLVRTLQKAIREFKKEQQIRKAQKAEMEAKKDSSVTVPPINNEDTSSNSSSDRQSANSTQCQANSDLHEGNLVEASESSSENRDASEIVQKSDLDSIEKGKSEEKQINEFLQSSYEMEEMTSSQPAYCRKRDGSTAQETFTVDTENSSTSQNSPPSESSAQRTSHLTDGSHANNDSAASSSSSEDEQDNSHPAVSPSNTPLIDESLSPEQQAQLAKMLKSEAHPPILKLLFCIAVWATMIVFSFARGGKGGTPSLFGVKRCGWVDWFLFALYLVLSLALAVFAGFVLIREHKTKKQLHYPFADGDVQWRVKTAVLYPLFCILAGFLAGFLGIGGALVTSPVLMEMGVIVPVVTATTSALLLATSSASTAQYAVSLFLPYDWGLFFFGLGILGSLVGTLVIARLAIKYHRYSVLLFSIALLFSISLIISGFHGIYTIVLIIIHGGRVSFSSPCK